MKSQEENEKVTWFIEELDNGIMIEDREILDKEVAVEDSGSDSKESIKLLLGEWFYRELQNAFSEQGTFCMRVTMQFKADL